MQFSSPWIPCQPRLILVLFANATLFSSPVNAFQSQNKAQSTEASSSPAATLESEKSKPANPPATPIAEKELAELRRRVYELGQKIAVLESTNASPIHPITLPSAEEIYRPANFSSILPLEIQSKDGAHQVRFNSRLHADARINLANNYFPNTFQLRRARFDVNAGMFHQRINLKLGLEFGRTGDADVRDAYVNFRPHSALQLTIGQQLLPFSTERLVSSNYMKHPERPIMVDQIIGPRDIGATLHGELIDKRILYAVGVYNGDGENKAADSDSDFDIVARLGFNLLRVLFVDGAYRYSPPNLTTPGIVDLATGGGQGTPFLEYDRENIVRRGGRHRASTGTRLQVGPVEAKVEFLVDKHEDIRSPTGVDRNLLDWSIFTDLSVALTGETNSGKDIVPKRPFFNPSTATNIGGTGAFELNFRYDFFQADRRTVSDNFAEGTERVHAGTCTLIWTLVPGFRTLLSYNFTRFADPIANRIGQLHNHDHILTLRTDFHF